MTESNHFVGLTDAQRDIVQHWASKQQDGYAPKREDIDPGVLCRHLDSISVVEIDVEGDIRFRIAGTKMRAILGQEVRGQSLNAISGAAADMFALGLTAAIDRQGPVGGVISRKRDQHAWLRLPMYSAVTGLPLILCHDALLPLDRLSGDPFCTASVKRLAA